jgi:hypothetical protein
MTRLSRRYNALAGGTAAEKKYPPPFSMRFTHEERAWLDAERGNKPLSVHIRERLFGDKVTAARRQISFEDHSHLEQACALLARGDGRQTHLKRRFRSIRDQSRRTLQDHRRKPGRRFERIPLFASQVSPNHQRLHGR